jgi:hypothetical protein
LHHAPVFTPGLNPAASVWKQIPLVYWLPAASTFVLFALWPYLRLHEYEVVIELTALLVAWMPFLANHELSGGSTDSVVAMKSVTLLSLPVVVLGPFVTQWRHVGSLVSQHIESNHKISFSLGIGGLFFVLPILFAGVWVVPVTESWWGLTFLHSGAALTFALLPISFAVALYSRLWQMLLDDRGAHVRKLHRRRKIDSDA